MTPGLLSQVFAGQLSDGLKPLIHVVRIGVNGHVTKVDLGRAKRAR